MLPAILSIGCRGSREAADLFASSLKGGWQLVRFEKAPPEKGAVRAWVAQYSGPASVKVRLFEMPSSANAFELVQRWRHVPGQAAFYQQQYYGEAASENADAAGLAQFVTAFKASLKGDRR